MTREGSKAVPFVAAGIATAFLLSPADGATRAAIIRVSVDSNGAQANGRSDPYPSISADGRFVAFASVASNLVAGDTNGASDIFVHGLVSRETTRVSVDSGGAQADGVSSRPAVSGDGRFIAFQSAASNLVAGDTNGATDIFVHDRESGETTRVSVANDGGQANASSFEPGINADGRFVTFFSPASNLVEGDTNNTYDAFVHDRVSGATIRASVDSAGVEGNSFTFMTTISGDGRVVAFESLSSNLVAGDTKSAFAKPRPPVACP
jgi:Tol biopolymer transport system component